MCASVVEVGTRLSDLVDDECLLIVNHQSTGDVPLLMTVFSHRSRPSFSQHIYWILDIMFRWTHFGIISKVRKDFFIREVLQFQ